MIRKETTVETSFLIAFLIKRKKVKTKLSLCSISYQDRRMYAEVDIKDIFSYTSLYGDVCEKLMATVLEGKWHPVKLYWVKDCITASRSENNFQSFDVWFFNSISNINPLAPEFSLKF